MANKPATPDSDVIKGSGCETVDWAKQSAVTRSWRTYLLQDSPSRFGLDEVILTLKSPADATKLAEKVRDDWKDCGKRQLTATVEKPAKFTDNGRAEHRDRGLDTTVMQKADNATTTFRVGIAAAGPKVVFTFLNPQDKLDLGAVSLRPRHRPGRAARHAGPLADSVTLVTHATHADVLPAQAG